MTKVLLAVEEDDVLFDYLLMDFTAKAKADAQKMVEEARRDCYKDMPTILTDFFCYWWNQTEGTNTVEASKKWWEENKQKYLGGIK
jgi:hypothetical protein